MTRLIVKQKRKKGEKLIKYKSKLFRYFQILMRKITKSFSLDFSEILFHILTKFKRFLSRLFYIYKAILRKIEIKHISCGSGVSISMVLTAPVIVVPVLFLSHNVIRDWVTKAMQKRSANIETQCRNVYFKVTYLPFEIANIMSELNDSTRQVSFFDLLLYANKVW